MFRTRWVLATLLAACLLGACSDDDPKPNVADPTPSAPSTAAATPSQSASKSEPRPEDAVRAWVTARNAALKSGATHEVRSLTDVSCRSCMSLITSIEEVYAAGGHFDTNGWEVKSAKARSNEGQRLTVDAAVVFSGGRTVNEAGADPVRYGPENHIMVFKLHDSAGTLVVDFVGFLS